ncbi:FliC/FljB family flagellin [Brenneria goodwinii]|uniref:Flagellin n=1 Tax=Brenneria goodwinii TaxID=1109412 RepID=A0A0G4K1S2_9GAMM|nr:FliC/FljB family flagellin [Brenneria goodwinii]MCG8158142.1 FliC/FljB family flagellin [Brenneria goodwinii]MCG8162483.1 FliC/FljB family flagellin [Brenneria goodwinii]MCG8167193.1 FliC/FljB family flagellin [Brenneria goodwinii]MCG8171853.1 FliC/FljB family flagellin [Brenneria goodwinii]MCG8176515.1 FliC/FljB family flagellin [Brenneria goodwinii]
MAQVINTNSISLIAQNNLNKSQSSLSTAIERLSSGLKINSAADNAAGQAISNRFTSAINGLTQASSNASDGISLAQTTEGALNEINDNLQAIRTLTVQSQNGTNSSTDLQSIQDEINQRLDEIDRISTQTDFNGVKVLDGSKTSVAIQVGSQDGQTISINLSKINRDTLGLSGFSVSGATPQLSDAVSTLGDGTAAPTSVDLSAAVSSLNTALSLSGDDALTADDISLHNVLDSTGAATDQYAVKYGDKVYAAEITGSAVSLITNDLDVTDGDLTGTVSGALVQLAADSTGNAAAYVSYNGTNYAATATDGTTTAITVGTTDAFTAAATSDPLAKLDEALATVDTLRSNLGAVQNRFDSTINNLASTTTNLSEAQSRIQDADYATEVSNMSKAQILQQAGTSVLAQANQVPQTVLSLLQ